MAERRPHGRTALILYGSETGNSQDAAEALGRVAERLHFVTRVSEMDRFEINQLSNYSIVVFSISTTGQGEFPKNSRKFWKSLLRKRLPLGCLDHVSFTTFGLGDTSYTKFNWAARKLHKRLEQLGAKEFYPGGEADEQHDEGIDGTFLPWSLGFSKHLLSQYPLPNGQEPIPSGDLLPPKFELVAASAALEDPAPAVTPFPTEVHLPIPDTLNAALVKNERITPMTHWQDVRLLTFVCDVKHSTLPGDTWKIYPQNFPEDVQTLIDALKWASVADIELDFQQCTQFNGTAAILESMPAGLYPLPKSTLRQLLTYNLDITAIPNRYFFELISHYTDDPTHKQRLAEFADPQYSDEYYDFATRPRRSILEILQDFDSLELPWKFACSFFPIIRGRQFSVASGGLKQRVSKDLVRKPGQVQVELLIAIVRYSTVLKKIRQGLCSRYLASMPTGTSITIAHESGSKAFWDKLDAFQERPVIMIAPGTGVAPCRSLIWERAEVAQKPPLSSPPRENGPQILLFGNRNYKADYFFKDEWEDPYLAVQVFTAFSRDQKAKIYIQDEIRRQAPLIYDLIMQKAFIYVCGSSGKMPQRVREALVYAILQGLKSTANDQSNLEREEQAMVEESERLFAVLEKEGRYIQETW